MPAIGIPMIDCIIIPPLLHVKKAAAGYQAPSWFRKSRSIGNIYFFHRKNVNGVDIFPMNVDFFPFAVTIGEENVQGGGTIRRSNNFVCENAK